MDDVLDVQPKKLAHKGGVCVTLVADGGGITFLVDTGSSASIINTDIYLDNSNSRRKPKRTCGTVHINASR